MAQVWNQRFEALDTLLQAKKRKYYKYKKEKG
jgi:hypothetical protein